MERTSSFLALRLFEASYRIISSESGFTGLQITFLV